MLGSVLAKAPAITLLSNRDGLDVFLVSLLFNDYRTNSRLFLLGLRDNRYLQNLFLETALP